MLSMTMQEYGDATVSVKLPKLRNEDAVEGESESNSRTRMFIAALPFATTESPMSVGGELSAGRLLEKLLHTHKLSHRLKVGELRKSLLQTKLKEDMSQRFNTENEHSDGAYTHNVCQCGPSKTHHVLIYVRVRFVSLPLGGRVTPLPSAGA